MLDEKIIVVTLFSIMIISGFTSIVLMLYISKTRIKVIDRAVLGHEYPHDSIFTLGLRIPNYGAGFLWKISAKRGGLEGKIEHFDKKFKRPFVINLILMIICVFCLILGAILQNYYGIK